MKITAYFMVLFLCAGCATLDHGKIGIIKDDFKDVTVVTMTMYHDSEVKSIFETTYGLAMKYSREFKRNEVLPVAVSLICRVLPLDDGFGETMFIKANDNIFELKLSDVKSESKSSTKTSTKTTKNVSTGKDKTSTSTKTYEWKELGAKVLLTKEIEENILNCNTLVVRLYSGPKPINFVIKPADIIKIKKYLTANPQQGRV